MTDDSLHHAMGRARILLVMLLVRENSEVYYYMPMKRKTHAMWMGGTYTVGVSA